MFNVALVKTIVSQAAGMSSAYIVKNIIANNVAPPETKFEIAKIWLGSFAIGGMVATHVQKDFHRNLDEIEAQYKKIKEDLDTPE